jgi:glycosyltransferase involved in cell wall biosynthesis
MFNGEAFLRETLASALAQDYRPIELLAVDQDSSDASLDLAARFDPLVRVLRQATGGPAAARNRGIREARGEFIAFLDQDDLWHPEKLSRQMARLRARPELAVCWSHAQLFWVDDLAQEGRGMPDTGAAASCRATRRPPCSPVAWRSIGPVSSTKASGSPTLKNGRCGPGTRAY